MGRLIHHTGPGWTYFVTTKAFNSSFLFQVEETARIVVAKLLEYRDKGNYLLHDFAMMPNHLHLILTPSSASLEKCMQLIKGGSSFEIHKLRGSKTEIWQPGFHESRVTSWTDYQKKRDYIRFNPVAAKLVEKPELWVYGSASGGFQLNPIPQGLKPIFLHTPNVGPKGPTPGAPTEVTGASGAKAPVGSPSTRGLKPPPPKENADVGAEAPTPGAVTDGELVRAKGQKA
jgi:REP element-mobilizing transposase RayT